MFWIKAVTTIFDVVICLIFIADCADIKSEDKREKSTFLEH